ncbi:hypothetical protein GCM10009665_69550 [Kitasatospora nipponensis]|uniref:Uncharacterized protein n=1 Tax=Kitasatospora nipponensis TaxID=258049 RepID=A0ABP4HP91_9ACTN
MLPVAPDQLINARIARSSLGPRPGFGNPFSNLKAQGVFIENPWGPVNVTQIGKPTGTGTSEMRSPMAPDASIFGVISPKQNFALGLGGNALTPAEADRTFLEWGRDRAQIVPFHAVCDGFACATIAILVATNSPLLPGTSVEWFGFVQSGVRGRGHAFAVVDRPAASNPADPTSWGNTCLVVDQWYGLQAGCAPAFALNGPTGNAAFLALLTAGGTAVKRVAGFTTGAYPWLKVREVD